jgi:predicted MPP superfamily phosphohydrolase
VGVPPDWLTPRWLLRILTSGFILPGEPAGPFAAPGGTDEPAFPGGRIDRLRREVAWFPVTRHRCPIPGLREPVRVLHLSDVHLRGEGDWLEQLVRDVSPLEADLVLLTGDVVARGWTERAVDRFLGALRAARLGSFACMGNWEHWGGAPPERWRGILARHGIELLVDEARTVGPLHLVGTDDGLSGRPDRQRILGALHPTLPNVVMTHSPAYFPALIDARVALVLSGHNHGGQVRVGTRGPLWLPRGWGGYLAGWYHAGSTRLFVHRGVGWSVFPVRYRSPPELAVLELQPAR